MEMLQQFEDLETEVTGTDIIIPNELTVGQELPDSENENEKFLWPVYQ